MDLFSWFQRAAVAFHIKSKISKAGASPLFRKGSKVDKANKGINKHDSDCQNSELIRLKSAMLLPIA
jgi:hypothetical protein